MPINWKSILIGIILAIMASIILKIAFGSAGSFLGVITACIIVGYISNKNLVSGVVHGAITGAIGGIFLGIFILIATITIGETVNTLITLGKATIIEFIIIWTGLGVMGSAIGSMIIIRSPEMATIKDGLKVTLNRENILKCACPQCSVQAESKCVQNKISMLKEMMKIEKEIMPEPENIPEMYCATGITTCSDLDTNKICNCPNCDVWKENNLTRGEKTSYFCRN